MTKQQEHTILDVVKRLPATTVVDLISELGPEEIAVNDFREATLLIYAIDRLTTPALEFMVEEINWKIDPKVYDGILLMSRFMRFLKARE